MPCNATVISAFQQQQLGFALSDSGWLMPWYFGVIWALQQLGVITPGITPVGAVSGGSVAAAASCLGLDFPSQVMPAVHAVARTCRSNNMCAGTLASHMEPCLTSLLLPAAENSTALARCGTHTHIFVSEGHPTIHFARGRTSFAGSIPRRINTTDPKGFVDGIAATWYIPYWSNVGSFSTVYQGHPAYEGFYSLPMPCPEGAKLCIRLSSRYPGPLLAKERPAMKVLSKMLLSRFKRPSMRILERVLDIASAELISPNQPPAPQPADIFPGKYNHVKYTPLQLAYKLALTPGSSSDLDYLFKLGQMDGVAWAKDVGLANLKACQAPV